MSTYENQTGRLPQQFLLKQRYIILGQTGRGGMGAVYEAVDTQESRRRVAIKEMSQGHLSDTGLLETTQRFLQEAEMLRRLSHPNLPHIYDSFSDRGRSYLVMDFIDGKTLLQMVKEAGGKPLPIAQVVYIAYQLCAVLQYLHSQRPPIIFRDLKPANVMVTSNGQVFLIDFGIARIFKEGQAQDTVFLGSPGYAPPEQHGTAQTNPRSDLYSLGATLHCCLTGKDPYYATDRFSFPPVRQLNPQVPLELDRLIQRLLSLDETQRPVSALEVQQVLANINQQASEHTSQISLPSPASAPTYYPLSSSAPNLPPSLQPPTVAIRSSAPPVAPMPHPSVAAPPSRTPSSGSIWTPSFILFFGLALLVTLGGSLIAFNFFTGSDHFFELVLSLLTLLVCLAATAFVHHFLARGILVATGLAMLIPALVFAVQGEIIPATTISNTDVRNQLLTGGLVVATLISLFWLARPFSIRDRFLLLILFGAADVCSLAQFFFRDEVVLQQLGQLQLVDSEAVIKHVFLIIVLIALIQGILLAVQMERVRLKPRIP